MDYNMLGYAFGIEPNIEFRIIGTPYKVTLTDEGFEEVNGRMLPQYYKVIKSEKGLIKALLRGNKVKYQNSEHKFIPSLDFHKLISSLGIPYGENFIVTDPKSVYKAKDCLYLNGVALPKLGDNSLESFIELFFKNSLKFRLGEVDK